MPPANLEELVSQMEVEQHDAEDFEDEKEASTSQAAEPSSHHNTDQDVHADSNASAAENLDQIPSTSETSQPQPPAPSCRRIHLIRIVNRFEERPIEEFGLDQAPCPRDVLEAKTRKDFTSVSILFHLL